jgi:hypothetical protein
LYENGKVKDGCDVMCVKMTVSVGETGWIEWGGWMSIDCLDRQKKGTIAFYSGGQDRRTTMCVECCLSCCVEVVVFLLSMARRQFLLVLKLF